MQNRLEKERAFHNEAFSTGIRKPLDAYYSIFGAIRNDFQKRLHSYAKGKNVLECGCGLNSYAKDLDPIVEELVGIDISDEAVHQSIKNADSFGLNNCRFLPMNAEALDFQSNHFDLIFGVGIIHHLDLPVFYEEASRVLKKQGSMLFMEPLGYNPFINLYRKLTPRLRTPDEHPLKRKDLGLLSDFFEQWTVSYYHFFTLLAIPLRNKRVFHPALNVLKRIDDFCFRYIPGFKYLAWYVIIETSKPK
jgi:ubiquinone/menaquinone biosynthesis C-methylase UbiE